MDSLNEEIDSTLDNSLMMEQDGFGQMAQAFGRSATNPIFKEFKQTMKRLDLDTDEGLAAAANPEGDDQAFLGAYRFYKSLHYALRLLKKGEDNLFKNKDKLSKMISPINEITQAEKLEQWLVKTIKNFEAKGFSLDKGSESRKRALKAIRAGRGAKDPSGPSGPSDPSKPKPEDTADIDRRRLAKIQDKAIDVLSKRTVLLGKEAYNNMRVINKVGNVVRKYFVSKVALREEDSSVVSLRGASSTGDTATSGETADILKQLSKKVLIKPEEAQKNLEKLMARLKKSKINQKFNALQDEDKEKNLEVVKSMIRRAAFSGLKENKIINEDKMVEIVIDFNELRKMELNESFLAMFGGWVEHLLKAMFGKYTPPVSIRGTQSDVRSFASALNGEKRYIEAAKRYGLDHPTTYKNRAKLDSSIKSFEKETGLTWPFK